MLMLSTYNSLSKIHKSYDHPYISCNYQLKKSSEGVKDILNYFLSNAATLIENNKDLSLIYDFFSKSLNNMSSLQLYIFFIY